MKRKLKRAQTLWPRRPDTNSKHWFTTSFLGGRCGKSLLGVWTRSRQWDTSYSRVTPILHADSTCGHATADLTTTRLCGCRQELGKTAAFITRTVLVGLITVQLRRQRGEELHSSSFLSCLYTPVSPSVCLSK